MTAELLILGLGNPLVGDDGIGAAVVHELLRRGLPEGVRAEVAHDILQLPSVWKGEREVWVVDAVQRGAEPGSTCLVEHDELLGLTGSHRSAHHLSLPHYSFPSVLIQTFRFNH